jgi:oligopeptide transport system permease protein
MADAVLAAAPAGRSLVALAARRLLRNRAAVTSVFVLALVAIACIVGPMVSPHGYDTIYRSYVRVPPSLEPYPRTAELEAAMRGALQQARVELGAFAVEGDRFRATLTASRPIDERVTRYIERNDAFRNPHVVAKATDGKSLEVEGDVRRVLFLFGTDANGRDLLTRILVGGQISLTIGLLATGVSLVIGVIWGAVAGYLGGRVDEIMMRFVDILYALPFVFFVILLVVMFGRNFVLIFVAVGAVEWLDMARIVRGQALALRRREFVEAARALGEGPLGILRRHIVPNTVGPVVVFATLLVPKVILLESFLSFLGLGVQEPLTSWGVLISEGAVSLQGAPWLLIFPSIFFVVTLFCLNFLGDGLRDALDPRDR